MQRMLVAPRHHRSLTLDEATGLVFNVIDDCVVPANVDDLAVVKHQNSLFHVRIDTVQLSEKCTAELAGAKKLRDTYRSLRLVAPG